MTDVVWCTHPRHLPPPPSGNTVVVDVAFAAGNQFKSKTKPFIDALGDRLIRWIDHHEHAGVWPKLKNDPRYLLKPNREAHACPELITPALVDAALDEAGGFVDHIVAHCDFDGAVSAIKFMLGGKKPWPEADEDARAVDSPGRGHTLSPFGQRLSDAMDQAAINYTREGRLDFMTRVVDAAVAGDFGPIDDELDRLAEEAQRVEKKARAAAKKRGKEEAPGVYVVRMPAKQNNQVRRHLLVAGEEVCPIGVLIEPDPEGGAWITAATFDTRVDLEEVKGFSGGRSDYRFARAKEGGHGQVKALSDYLARVTGADAAE